MPAPSQGPAALAALRDLPSEGAIDWDDTYRAVAAAMAEASFDPAAVRTGAPSPAKGDTTFIAIAIVDHDGPASL